MTYKFYSAAGSRYSDISIPLLGPSILAFSHVKHASKVVLLLCFAVPVSGESFLDTLRLVKLLYFLPGLEDPELKPRCLIYKFIVFRAV